MSKAFTIKVEGEKELQMMLQRFINVSTEKAQKVVKNSALRIQERAKETVPVQGAANLPKGKGGGGALKNSIEVKFEQGGNSATIGSHLEYAPFVEYGTRAMERAHGVHDPKNPVRDWDAKRKRGAASQTMPFLTPAFLEEREDFMRYLREQIGKEVRKRNR